jgi:hypothetical protein
MTIRAVVIITQVEPDYRIHAPAELTGLVASHER